MAHPSPASSHIPTLTSLYWISPSNLPLFLHFPILLCSMATDHFSSFVFLIFALPFFSPVVLSRTFQSSSKTTTLDISTSLQEALDVLSFNPINQQTFNQEEEQQQQEAVVTSPTSFTLELHSRDSLKPTSHHDYLILTKARVERDSARVKGLNARLDLAVKGIKKSELKPVEEDQEFAIKADDLEGPVISGTSQGSGEYFSRVGMGQPPKPLYMVLDTGSDITWIQCQPCTDCYQQADPVFDPSSSSTYAPLTCDSTQCKALDVSACRNTTCLYQVSYGDGSYTVGDFATESLTFGTAASVKNIAVGCGHDNEGLFVGAAGLLGLGGGSLSFPSQISVSSFSYCLVDRDSSSSSTLIFGTAAGTGATVTAPLLKNGKLDTFYYVGLSGISVGGSPVSIPSSSFQVDESGNGGVIVDSGTAITRLQTGDYNALRDAFTKGTRDLPSASSVALFDTCYDLSSKTSVEVPTLVFHFPGGQSLQLPAKNYLIPVDSVGTFCFAFAPTNSPLSIIGNVQQQGIRVSFDLANSLVGFAPNKC